MRKDETYVCPICAYVTTGRGARANRHCGACHRQRLRESLDWMPTWMLRWFRFWSRAVLVLPSARRDPEVVANIAVIDDLLRNRTV